MSWEHFDIHDFGTCNVVKVETGEKCDAFYQMGIITTGRSRVFWGYQITIEIDDDVVIGRSKGNSETYSLALDDCNVQLAEKGMKLLVAGNSKQYKESALTGGGGGGYLKGKSKPVGIMSFFDDETTWIKKLSLSVSYYISDHLLCR